MFKRKYYLSFFILTCFFHSILFSQENSPGTPSSSYNNDYFSKSKKLKSYAPVQMDLANRIIIQGNKRIESSVIIRDSEIDSLNSNEKGLSVAIKNLYKTG